MDPKKFNEIISSRIKMGRRYTSMYNKGNTVRETSLIPKLVPSTAPCRDCGKITVGVEQKIYIFKVGTPQQQWRKKCMTCDNYIPLSGKKLLD